MTGRRHADLRVITDGPDDAETTLRTLARVLRPYLRALEEEERHGAQLVDVLKFVPAPKRTVMAACRTGKIDGATKVGRRWLAPRAAVERWLRQRGPRVVPDKPDRLEALRRRLSSP